MKWNCPYYFKRYHHARRATNTCPQNQIYMPIHNFFFFKKKRNLKICWIHANCKNQKLNNWGEWSSLVHWINDQLLTLIDLIPFLLWFDLIIIFINNKTIHFFISIEQAGKFDRFSSQINKSNNNCNNDNILSFLNCFIRKDKKKKISLKSRKVFLRWNQRCISWNEIYGGHFSGCDLITCLIRWTPKFQPQSEISCKKGLSDWSCQTPPMPRSKFNGKNKNFSAQPLIKWAYWALW